MSLVRLPDGPSPWLDIKDAAAILWRSTLAPDMGGIAYGLQEHYHNPHLSAFELNTGFNESRRGIVVYNDDKIAIAFLGSDPKELHKNMWVFAQARKWCHIFPYPVYENGNQVHNFYRDMWRAMQQATYDALSRAVEDMAARGTMPKQILVTGYSMGGGISIMAFTDILEKIRHTWGSQSASPQSWAQDEELGSLVPHLTFAAMPAGDQGYYTVLNDLYAKYQIRAWDFLHHFDLTIHAHHIQFRSWRGYRYILPHEIVKPFANEFNGNSHGILGYLKVAEWMFEHGTDQVKTRYNY